MEFEDSTLLSGTIFAEFARLPHLESLPSPMKKESPCKRERPPTSTDTAPRKRRRSRADDETPTRRSARILANRGVRYPRKPLRYVEKIPTEEYNNVVDYIDERDVRWMQCYRVLLDFVVQHGRLPRCKDRHGDFAVGQWLRGQKRRAITRKCGKLLTRLIFKHPFMREIIEEHIARCSRKV